IENTASVCLLQIDVLHEESDEHRASQYLAGLLQ
ncbi:hypothetical protein H310_15387, partial [Aphanomyces invadans]